MLLRVLMAVTALMRSWNGYSAFERMLCLFPIIRFSLVFTIGFNVLLCGFHVTYGRACLLLSAFSLWVLASLMSDGQTLLSTSASTVSSINVDFEHHMWMVFLASFLVEIDMAMIAVSCHIALDLICYIEGVSDSV